MKTWISALALACATFLELNHRVEAAAPPPISVYGALPAQEKPTISPSGDRLALFLNKGEQHVVVVRQLDGDRKILQTLQINDRVGGAVWADDDHLFVISHRTFNTGTEAVSEGYFVFLLNLKTGVSKQVAPDGSFDDVGLPELTIHKDGRAYCYFQGGNRLFRVDLDSLQIITVARSGQDQGGFVLSPQAEIIARMQYKDYGKKWSILKGEQDSTVLAHGESDVGGSAVAGLGRTPDTVLIVDTLNGDLANPREINLKDGSVSAPLATGPVGIAPLYDQSSRLLIGFRLGGYADDHVFFDDALHAAWNGVKAAFPGKAVILQSVSKDRKRWVVNINGPHDSGHDFLVDLKSHQAVNLGATYPEIANDQVGDMSWFKYKTSDGLAEKALLTLPPGQTLETARRLPAVVLPHGGPQGRDYFGFDWWAQALASRGYVVIQPQFRGSGDFGFNFAQAGWGQWGRLMQTDVSDAFKAVAEAGYVDPGRTCIVGWSYGGYVTMAAVTVQTGLYRCAAAGAGVSDLNSMLVWSRDRAGKLGPTVRYWKTSQGLKGENDPAGYAVSPAKLASRVTVPLMLIHGRQDTTVPLSQSQEMADAMRQAGKPVEFVILENETHHIESASTRTKMLEAMIGFLERNNPGK